MNEELIRKTVEAVIAGWNEPAQAAQSGAQNSAGKTVDPDKIDTICLRAAKALIKRVEQEAASRGMAVVIAVADKAGHPVAIHCMDGAYIGSFDVALNKTYTSIAFKMSTAQLGKLSGPGQPLYGIQYTNGGRIVIFGGGEPLMIGDRIVGSVGVSGGTAQQDTDLAAFAKQYFEEVALCQQK
ncbi:MAG: heme-binding protein [Lachnospiraceae bacterium]|nr:heme-binding protein [Lachnospiraceae bacterium]